MRISLAGNNWRFRAFLDGAWRHEHAAAPGTSDAAWHLGTVPGSVQQRMAHGTPSRCK